MHYSCDPGVNYLLLKKSAITDALFNLYIVKVEPIIIHYSSSVSVARSVITALSSAIA